MNNIHGFKSMGCYGYGLDMDMAIHGIRQSYCFISFKRNINK